VGKSKVKISGELQKLGLLFGLAFLMYQMVYGIFTTYFSYFLTDIAKMGAASMGTIVSVGGIIDTVSIFVCGFIVQNTQFKWGKYRSWLKFMPIIFSAGYVLMFIIYPFGESFTVALLIILYAIGGITGNFTLLASRGLQAKCGKDQDGRVFLVGREAFFSTIARVIYGALFLWFVALAGQGSDAKGYLIYFAIFGVLNIVGWYVVYRATKKHDIFIANKTAEQEVSKLGVKSTWNAIKGNGQFLVFMSSELIMDIGVMVSYMVMAYFFTYAVGDMKYMTWYMTTSTITGVIGTAIGPYVCRIANKKTVFTMSLISYGVTFAICYIQFLISGTSNPWFFLVVINIGIILFNFQGAIKNSLFMDCAEYGFHKTGKETMAFLMSFANLPFKIAIAIGGAIIGYGLSAIGYVANMTPTHEFTVKLCNIALLFPACCFVVCGLIFIFGYRLTNARMEEIMASNKKKKIELGLITEESDAEVAG
jgi:GPH family glycoside/pentoside/hexuronide:cation symporter